MAAANQPEPPFPDPEDEPVDEFDPALAELAPEPGDAESSALSIAEAIETARSAARKAPGVWHQLQTRRFALHVAWFTAPDGREVLRVHRELLRPNVEDLVAVLRHLPVDAAVTRFELRREPSPVAGGMPRQYLHLHLRPRGTGRGDPAEACTHCGRRRERGRPLVGDEQVCLYCATGATPS